MRYSLIKPYGRSGLFFLFLFCLGFIAFDQQRLEDAYEVSLLLGGLLSLWLLSLRWPAIAYCSVSVVALSSIALALERWHATTMFFLSSQAAILWMSLSFCFALMFYLLALWRPRQALGLATSSTWIAIVIGWHALLMRWLESYRLGIGHIPLSSLYEVMVLFCLITAMLQLYYQKRYARAIGAFVLPWIIAALAFLFWSAVYRNAQLIQGLVPALQSWWMKLHVPANFIGYGAFTIAGMSGFAYLLPRSKKSVLPEQEVLAELMYRAVVFGFLFFTLATILGALWAAEAWGGYWSWDPKETWALIVWLNYAAWLHMHLLQRLNARILAWWAIIGLLLTLFAFLGVNLFLSGLHSYGQL